MTAPEQGPQYVVPEPNRVPVYDYLGQMATIPPSRMFLINKSLKTYREANPDGKTFDASQGDGGASLPGVPTEDKNDSFWLVDASLGYRLPERRGLVSLGVANLFDEDFKFVDTDPFNPRVYPERFVFGRITLSF